MERTHLPKQEIRRRFLLLFSCALLLLGLNGVLTEQPCNNRRSEQGFHRHSPKISSSVKLGNFNDYFIGTQGCAQPSKFMTVNRGQSSSARVKNGTVSVVLSDCMACSGCASPESAVMSKTFQVDEIESLFNISGVKVVTTLSPQSLTSLAVAYNTSASSAFPIISHILRSIGAASVVPTQALAQPLAICAAADEFIERYLHFIQERSGNPRVYRNSGVIKRDSQLPLLCAECPGWVNYVFRRGRSRLERHLSNVKSTMAISAALFQNITQLSSSQSLKTFHIHVAPCYDKRIEALQHTTKDARNIDLLLTTEELKAVLDETLRRQHQGFADIQRNISQDQDLYRPPDTGLSGGYAHNVMRITAKKVFNISLQEVKFTKAKNNFWESRLVVHGEEQLRCALVYGYKNVQMLVKDIMAGSSPYHYVEVMACPSGCPNGGGQIKVPASTGHSHMKSQRELIRRQHEQHFELPVMTPEDVSEVRLIRERANKEMFKTLFLGPASTHNWLARKEHTASRRSKTNAARMDW